MKKFIFGTVFGVLLVFAGLFSMVMYIKSPHAELNRCMNLYLEHSDDLRKDPTVLDIMKQRGFNSYEDLVKDRCQTWIKNGQKF